MLVFFVQWATKGTDVQLCVHRVQLCFRADNCVAAEERELMQKWAGSLKENQPMQVYTNAGVFATTLNCGIIVSLANLVGAES